MPENFGQVEAYVVAEPKQDPVLIEAAYRYALLVGAAEIENEAAVIGEFPKNETGKVGEPINILVLIFVAVLLLALQREWRLVMTKLTEPSGTWRRRSSESPW